MAGKSLTGCVTRPYKTINEDCIVRIDNPRLALNGIILADGIGSMAHSDQASAQVAHWLRQALEALDTAGQLDIIALFSGCHHALIDVFTEKFAGEGTFHELLGTTLVCLLETDDEFLLAYVGNGAALHLRGTAPAHLENFCIPWDAVNYLAPHSAYQKGRSPLYRYMSADPDAGRVLPTVVRVTKDKDGWGDLFMICSDGLYSSDNAPIDLRESADGNRFIQFDEKLSLFFDRLKDLSSAGSEEELDRLLCDFLQHLDDQRLLGDDCSLGLILTPAFLKAIRN